MSALLVDGEILEEIERGTIVIRPFDRQNLGTNSYDVHLGKTLATYRSHTLDARDHNPIDYFEIPEEGYVLQPGKFYLGATTEYTETHEFVPIIEGKSSLGRLGCLVHYTAGWGDLKFSGVWTLEISCIKPLRVYAGMPVAQLLYFRANPQKVLIPYDKKPNAKYNNNDHRPKESMLYKNFPLNQQKSGDDN